MKLVEDLIARAQAADAAMGDLAAVESNRLDREQVYKRLESLFDEAASDGQLTEKEVTELMAAFKAAGLSTAALDKIATEMKESDGVARTSPEMRTEMAGVFRDALRQVRGEDPFFEFKAQVLSRTYKESIDAASTVEKSQHDKYMTAIRNLVA